MMLRTISGSKEMTTEKNFDLQERIKSTENSNKYLDFVLNPKYVTKLFFFSKFSDYSVENKLWESGVYEKNGSGKSI